MLKVLAGFLSDEDGAVTVDWVVLTAAVVGLGLAVILSVATGALDQAGGLGAYIKKQTVTTSY